MLNLHPPFRTALQADRDAILALGPGGDPGYGAIGADLGGCVVAEEAGSLLAVMHVRPDEDSLRVDLLAVVPERIEDLGPRLLAVADARAAEEGLARILLNAEAAGAEVWFILDQEGFRPADPPASQGGAAWFSRDVIPAG